MWESIILKFKFFKKKIGNIIVRSSSFNLNLKISILTIVEKLRVMKHFLNFVESLPSEAGQDD